jgi:hypothetical protein
MTWVFGVLDSLQLKNDLSNHVCIDKHCPYYLRRGWHAGPGRSTPPVPQHAKYSAKIDLLLLAFVHVKKGIIPVSATRGDCCLSASFAEDLFIYAVVWFAHKEMKRQLL